MCLKYGQQLTLAFLVVGPFTPTLVCMHMSPGLAIHVHCFQHPSQLSHEEVHSLPSLAGLGTHLSTFTPGLHQFPHVNPASGVLRFENACSPFTHTVVEHSCYMAMAGSDGNTWAVRREESAIRIFKSASSAHCVWQSREEAI